MDVKDHLTSNEHEKHNDMAIVSQTRPARSVTGNCCHKDTLEDIGEIIYWRDTQAIDATADEVCG